ncbi:hypothetical protein [Glaciibacter psychrotolerans]|uniref:Uncharacterized protein n=1 Tax=Glaciibacter psychrotolerans TaxID=670054 RepID=A0A7Z0EDZ3_9MICO|nr:hypothetical protein [Leifsonia psychrotolerans]NYJ19916.1 hypothetical protein [Leifsonia psychrotolerans]
MTTDGVLCLQQYIKYAPLPGNCPSTFAAAAVLLGEGGVSYPCLSSDITSATVLGYDTPIVNGEYSCSINLSTGISCFNGAGVGFRMENESGVTAIP